MIYDINSRFRHLKSIENEERKKYFEVFVSIVCFFS